MKSQEVLNSKFYFSLQRFLIREGRNVIILVTKNASEQVSGSGSQESLGYPRNDKCVIGVSEPFFHLLTLEPVGLSLF